MDVFFVEMWFIISIHQSDRFHKYLSSTSMVSVFSETVMWVSKLETVTLFWIYSIYPHVQAALVISRVYCAERGVRELEISSLAFCRYRNDKWPMLVIYGNFVYISMYSVYFDTIVTGFWNAILHWDHFSGSIGCWLNFNRSVMRVRCAVWYFGSNDIHVYNSSISTQAAPINTYSRI